ncbi:ABC transporter permease [Nonomuraea sp. NPDC050404]|uniref:ABC transporter permease n=1 Tax=Nonomuraea sp. NPDC050404 TaxID=3155783 RepID=UPI00340F43C8
MSVPATDLRTSAGRTDLRSAAGRAGRVVLPLVVPLIVIAIWEYVGRQRLLADGLFPAASASLAALLDWLFGWRIMDGFTPSPVYSGTWLAHMGSSVFRILLGYGIGSALAIALGLLSGASATGRRLVDPTVSAIRPISVTGWIPLALLLFGIGDSPAIFLTALATFFPVYVNTLSGVRLADGNLVRAAAMLGASKRRILIRVTLPAAAPNIVTGLRVASGIAWTTVVVAEILGAKSGLGYVLIDSYNQFRLDYVIAAMASLGACGFLTDRLVQWIFADSLRWSRSS